MLTSSLYQRYNAQAKAADNSDKAKTVVLKLVLTDEQKKAIADAVGESAGQKELGIKLMLSADTFGATDEAGKPVQLIVGHRQNAKTGALTNATLWCPVVAM